MNPAPSIELRTGQKFEMFARPRGLVPSKHFFLLQAYDITPLFPVDWLILLSYETFLADHHVR